MQNNLNIIIFLTVLLAAFKVNANECSMKVIKQEVTKFHGPEWSKISHLCSNTQIKSHLRNIISKPDQILNEFETEHQKFIFRNVIKSYGHFGTQSSDLNLLSGIYNDQKQILSQLFGSDANLFRITILESMANTGNPDALNFFEKIIENDNNVLFLQKSALDFAAWVFEGSPLLHHGDSAKGSKIYSEVFAPNLEGSAEKRFHNKIDILEKIEDKKNKFKLLLGDMLLRQDRFKAINPSLENLKNVLESSVVDAEVPSNLENISQENLQKSSIQKKESKKQTRRIASQEVQKNNTSSNYWVAVLLLLCIGIIFLLRIKRD